MTAPFVGGTSPWLQRIEQWGSELLGAINVEPSKWFTPIDARMQRIAEAGAWGEWPDGVARPKQRPPEGEWFVWILQPGRGFGKTRCGGEWFNDRAVNHHKRGDQMLLAGRTPSDVEKYALNGPGGLLTHHPEIVYKARTLYWPNGVTAVVRSGANPEEFRGFSGATAWLDEFAAWMYARRAWDNMLFGMREKDPRICVTTTPRPTEVFKAILKLKDAIVVRGNSYENAANLDKRYVAQVLDAYAGTRTGRQEIEGEVLEDIEGALWKQSMIDELRVTPDEVPPLRRIVVAVDPQGVKDKSAAMKRGEETPKAMTGIVAVGQAHNGHFYVLRDASINGSPNEWGTRAVGTLDDLQGDRIVGETNYGGEMVEHVVRTVRKNVPYTMVHATRGKVRRAEPIVTLYERGLVHHVGPLPALESEMTSFVEGESASPNRMDACLDAATMIEVRGGAKRIDAVQVGDEVLTRSGWRRVLRAERTRERAQVIELRLSTGASLIATPDHRIWTENRGWVDADALVCDDRLRECTHSASRIEASSSSGTRVPSTIRRLAARAWRCCTARSTRITTGRSLAASSSTIATTIRSTTTPATLWRSVARSMASIIDDLHRRLSVRISRAFDLSLPSGIALQLASDGTLNTRSASGVSASLPSSVASSAASAPRRGSPTSATARVAVIVAPLIARIATWSRRAARSAARGSCAASTATSLRPAVVVVERRCVAGERPVWNLEVECEHEFFANGVLVHNCVWGLTELSQGKPVVKQLTW